MCELHFHPHEILRTTSTFDEKNGKTVKQTSSSNFLPIPIAIAEEDISSASDTIPVIAYIGGYCDSINKKLKCEECKLRIVSSDVDDTSFNYSLIKGISRGKLLYPNADILHIGLISYIVIQKIACF